MIRFMLTVGALYDFSIVFFLTPVFFLGHFLQDLNGFIESSEYVQKFPFYSIGGNPFGCEHK